MHLRGNGEWSFYKVLTFVFRRSSQRWWRTINDCIDSLCFCQMSPKTKGWPWKLKSILVKERWIPISNQSFLENCTVKIQQWCWICLHANENTRPILHNVLHNRRACIHKWVFCLCTPRIRMLHLYDSNRSTDQLPWFSLSKISPSIPWLRDLKLKQLLIFDDESFTTSQYFNLNSPCEVSDH